MFFTKEDRQDEIARNVDEYNDSYARDVTPEELKTILDGAKTKVKDGHFEDSTDVSRLSESIFAEAQELGFSTVGGKEESPSGWLFKGLTIYFHDISFSSSASTTSNGSSADRLWLAQKLTEFGGADLAESFDDDDNNDTSRPSKRSKGHKATTHIVIGSNAPKNEISSIRKTLTQRQMSGDNNGLRIPHLVTVEWVEQSWKEKTLLDEESMLFFLYFYFITYSIYLFS